MSVYMVQFDGEQYIVEAPSFVEAITRWQKHMKQEHGDEWDEQPDSIVALSNNEAIR